MASMVGFGLTLLVVHCTAWALSTSKLEHEHFTLKFFSSVFFIIYQFRTVILYNRNAVALRHFSRQLLLTWWQRWELGNCERCAPIFSCMKNGNNLDCFINTRCYFLWMPFSCKAVLRLKLMLGQRLRFPPRNLKLVYPEETTVVPLFHSC